MMTFALAGNQNCGKTTLFNQLTGSNQHVGNFPGVTVDKKEGVIRGHKTGEHHFGPRSWGHPRHKRQDIPPREEATVVDRHLFPVALHQRGDRHARFSHQ